MCVYVKVGCPVVLPRMHKLRIFEQFCTGKHDATYAEIENRQVIVHMCGTGFKV